jgi:phosphopentomutase
MTGSRLFLIILDSVGIGAAPDAAAYGDEGSNTLAHVAAACGGLDVPFMQSLGLGNIPALLHCGEGIAGVPASHRPAGAFGAMAERSSGKDTTTGHWEIAGLLIEHGFALFPPGPPSFPPDLIAGIERHTGRSIIGNCAASGTAIIEELGPRHMKEGSWIVYTSGDSVFQIAAHEGVIPLRELYRCCEIARSLCNPLRVGRVIARPFVGEPGAFKRTENRRDYSFPLPEPTVLDLLVEHGLNVSLVGKLDDIFAGRGFTASVHVENSAAAAAAVIGMAGDSTDGLVFANLIDFDMRYGHRRDPKGYGAALREADSFLSRLAARLRPDDAMLITADHGNDPTFRGTDHTREYVPLLVCGSGYDGAPLGVRDGFFDVAQSIASFFSLPRWPRGVPFLLPKR